MYSTTTKSCCNFKIPSIIKIQNVEEEKIKTWPEKNKNFTTSSRCPLESRMY